MYLPINSYTASLTRVASSQSLADNASCKTLEFSKFGCLSDNTLNTFTALVLSFVLGSSNTCLAKSSMRCRIYPNQAPRARYIVCGIEGVYHTACVT